MVRVEIIKKQIVDDLMSGEGRSATYFMKKTNQSKKLIDEALNELLNDKKAYKEPAAHKNEMVWFLNPFDLGLLKTKLVTQLWDKNIQL